MEIRCVLMAKLTQSEGVGKNGQPWKMASYLAKVEGMYEKKIVFEVSDGMAGRIAQFDAAIGKEVVVGFDINASEYQGRWYNRVRAYGVKQMVAVATAAVTAPEVAPVAAPAAAPVVENVEMIDAMPF